MSSLLLYHFPPSLSSQVVRLALCEKGIAYRERVVDAGLWLQSYQPWFMQWRGEGGMPVLRSGAETISGVEHILHFLEWQFPLSPLKPSMARSRDWVSQAQHARALLRAQQLSNGLRCALHIKCVHWDLNRRIHCLQAYTKRDDQLSSIYQLKLKEVLDHAAALTNPDAMTLAKEEAWQALRELDRLIGERPFLGGHRFSVADCCWVPLLARLQMPALQSHFDFQQLPLLAAYYARMRRRHSFRQAGIVNPTPTQLLKALVLGAVQWILRGQEWPK